MLNAIGCLILATVVFTQWGKESRTDDAMTRLRLELADARHLAETETKRAADLERDIAVLKQSFEATRLAAVAAQKSIGVSNISNQLDDARGQIESWKTAMATRDARIHELESDLTATRRRLDEAIAKLKQAGAR